MTGFWFRFAITTDVVAVADPAVGVLLSTADQLTVYVPDCVRLGVPVNVMLGLSNGPAEVGPVRNGAVVVRLSVTS